MTGPCTRCGTTLPSDLPREGTVQRFTLHKTTTTATQTHVLRLRRWRFVWMPEHSGDRLASSTFTDLDLCGSCVGVVWVFATAALFPERPSDLAAEVERRRERVAVAVASYHAPITTTEREDFAATMAQLSALLAGREADR